MRKDWEVKKLGDLSISLKNGLTIKQDKSGCGIPVTRIETLSNGIFNRDKLGYANIYDKEQYCDYILDDKDLLISHINSKQYVGRTVLYRKAENESIIHGMNLLRLKLNNDFTLPEFIVYYFKSSYIKEQIRKYRKDAVNQSSISITDINKIRLFVPPLQTQQQIVEELDCLTSIIEKQKKQLEELDNLAQAIFYDMFGEPMENEKGWNIKKLEDIVHKNCTLSYGIVQPMEDVVDGVPIVRPIDLIDTFVSDTSLKRTRKEISNKYKRTILTGHEILLCVRGTTGIVSLVNESFAGYNVTRGIVPILLSSLYNRWFVYYQIKTSSIQQKISELTYGIALRQINIKDLRALTLITPPLSLQQQFASKIEAIEKQKELIKKSIKETEDLFNSRMDYYFN